MTAATPDDFEVVLNSIDTVRAKAFAVVNTIQSRLLGMTGYIWRMRRFCKTHRL